jgi:heme-degrading monooxygenase HmoA
MSPTEAAVEHWRLQREFEAARKTGDERGIRRTRNALEKLVERRYQSCPK